MQNKPEFRLPSIGGEPTYIPQTLRYLYDRCDAYRPCRPEVLGEQDDPENGQFWMFQFVLWRGQHELTLELYPYGLHGLWMQFMMDGESVRGLPTEYINVMELARRVRDFLAELYQFAYAEPTGVEFTHFWVMSYIEDSDGYGSRRRWVYEKFFVLDPVTRWTDCTTGQEVLPEPGEELTYLFIPRTLTEGPEALFFPRETLLSA